VSNALLFETVRRWFEIIERRPIDADGFGGYEVWMYSQTLSALAEANQPLPADALGMMSEIGERLGLPVGAPPAAIGVAWEAHFGECPFGAEVLATLTTYVRSQLNAFTDPAPKKGPSLTGEAKPGSETHVYPPKDLWS
jgi:hypothetical protein